MQDIGLEAVEMVGRVFVFVFVSAMVFCFGGCGSETKTESGEAMNHFKVYPIGRVVKTDGKCSIVIDEKYEAGLLGLDKQKHLHVLYWFDRNDTPKKRAIMQVHPRGDKNNPLTGVFGTHSPFRPNLIAVSRCDVISVKGNVIEIEDIDAFDGSPVIDLKGDFFFYHGRDKK